MTNEPTAQRSIQALEEKREKLDKAQRRLARSVGQFIRQARRDRRLTQHTVATEAGIHAPRLCTIEQGEVLLSSDLFNRIMAAIRRP